jgi:heme/copper-type cytochrome/quinol oxidase subunit 4
MPLRPIWHYNSWDEFHDEEIVDWKRCRQAIEHENQLVNHRLSWLFASQGFLFAAFGAIWNGWKYSASTRDSTDPITSIFVLMIICFVGIVVCAGIQKSLLEAEMQLASLDKWWYFSGDCNTGSTYHSIGERERLQGIRDAMHPPLQGGVHVRGNFLSRLFSFTNTPSWFIVAWVLIGGFAIHGVSLFVAYFTLVVACLIVAIFTMAGGRDARSTSNFISFILYLVLSVSSFLLIAHGGLSLAFKLFTYLCAGVSTVSSLLLLYKYLYRRKAPRPVAQRVYFSDTHLIVDFDNLSVKRRKISKCIKLQAGSDAQRNQYTFIRATSSSPPFAVYWESLNYILNIDSLDS